MTRRIRYAAWLPLVHLAIMAPLISIEEARGWKFISVQQRAEDHEKTHPQKPELSNDVEPQVGWVPYYEYRPSISVLAIYSVEFPASFLFSWCGHPPPWAFSFTPPYGETWCRLFGFLRVRTRIVILDLLLLAAIYFQWWFIGSRLDGLEFQRKPIALIKLPAVAITFAGTLAALLSQGPDILELIAVLACLLALLGWAALILAGTTIVGKTVSQYLRRRSAST